MKLFQMAPAERRLTWTTDTQDADLVPLDAIEQAIALSTFGLEEFLPNVTPKRSSFRSVAMLQCTFLQSVDGVLKGIQPGRRACRRHNL